MSGLNVQMIFNPQNCSLEQLESTITENRKELADRILSQFEESVKKGGSNNNLIIGPRGTGKTHLIHYIRRIITNRKYPESETVNIISLSEEERGITTLFHFIIACLRAFGVPNETILIHLSGLDMIQAKKEAQDFFSEVMKNKPTLIIMENLSDIFDGLGEDGLSDLRAFLQNSPHISILASSVFLFKESSKPDHPFYGYFSIHPLSFLNEKESGEFLKLLAKANGNHNLNAALTEETGRRRVMAIHHITGGNHRLLSMLSHFLDAELLEELVQPFQQMVDRELTPYYQQRLDRLTRQQFQIIQSIADQHGKALSVKDIAIYSFLDQNIVSRQLYDLIGNGYVQKKAIGRESWYELREPLLRLVLDMKEGRDKPLPIIVELLKEWYDSEEIKSLAEKTKEEFLPYYQMALAEKEKSFGEEGKLGAESLQRMEKPGVGLSDFGRKILEEIDDLIKQGNFSKAAEKSDDLISACNKVIEKLSGSDDPQLMEQVAISLVNKGFALYSQGKADEEIACYNDVIERYSGSENRELMEQVAISLLNKGVAFRSQGKADEAIACYNEVIERYSGSENRELMEQVARSLLNKGVALGSQGKADEAIACYNDVIERYSGSEYRELMEQVAISLVNKGVALGSQGKADEEIACYNEVIERYSGLENRELMENVARSLVNKGFALGSQGKADEAIACYNEIIERYSGSENRELMETVAISLFNKGFAFRSQGKADEEIACYNDVIERYSGSENRELMETVGKALINKILVLIQTHREKEGLELITHSLKSNILNKEHRTLLASFLLQFFLENISTLRKIRNIYKDDYASLKGGLIFLIQSILPISGDKARELVKPEENLKSVFGDIPELKMVLDMLNAARRDALGDKKALLGIPLELRQLILSRKESKAKSRAHLDSVPKDVG